MYDLFVPKLFGFDPNFRDLINHNVNRNKRRPNIRVDLCIVVSLVQKGHPMLIEW